MGGTMHARIAVYELVSGDLEELSERTAAALGAILAGKPGFLSYRIGVDDGGRIVVLNEWETKEQAEAALPAAAAWVRDNLAENVRLIEPRVVDFHHGYPE